MSRRPIRLRSVLFWLLTPVVAWAASFGGSWIAARVGGTLLALVVGGLAGAGMGAVGWMLLIGRTGSTTRGPEHTDVDPGNNT